MRAMLWMAAILGVVVMSNAHADDKPDTKAIDGVWIIEKAEMDGTDITVALKQYVLTLEKGTYTLDDKGKQDAGTIKLDATKSPKQMDIIGGPESPFKGKTFPCIYDVKDGKLTVCYGMDFKTRPTEFTTEKDSKRMLAVYKKK